MIYDWKCFVFIALKILMVTADQQYELSLQLLFSNSSNDKATMDEFHATNGPKNDTIYGKPGRDIEAEEDDSWIYEKSDTCSQPLDPGSCLESYYYLLRWHYNSSKGYCEMFLYNGCDGNYNNFRYLKDCEQACVKQTLKDTTTKLELPPTTYTEPDMEEETWDYKNSKRNERSNICNQPKDRGFCWGSFTYFRWYYNNLTNSCKLFAYTGCGGNDNRFAYKQDCTLLCVRDSPKDETAIDGLQPTEQEVGYTIVTEPDLEETAENGKGLDDVQDEILIEVDVHKPVRVTSRTSSYFGSTVITILVCAVVISIRVFMIKYRRAGQEMQSLRSIREADQRTPSTGENSSPPPRITVCLLSLRKPEKQSSNEFTAGSKIHKSDQNPSTDQLFRSSLARSDVYPSDPPPYEP